MKTSPVPPKPAFFASLKSTNYLPNVLAIMDAEADGYDQGIFVDSSGNVLEAPNANVGIITHEGCLVIPPFDNCLPGVSVRHLMELAQGAIQRGSLENVSRIEQRPISVDEAKGAREVFLIGTAAMVMPVVTWDEAEIGDGTPGLGVLQLRVLLQSAMELAPGSDHTPILYGVTTGMGS